MILQPCQISSPGRLNRFPLIAPTATPRDFERVRLEVDLDGLVPRVRALWTTLDVPLVYTPVTLEGQVVLESGDDHLSVPCVGLGLDHGVREPERAELRRGTF